MRYFRQFLIFTCILGLTSNLIFAQNTEEEEKKELITGCFNIKAAWFWGMHCEM